MKHHHLSNFWPLMSGSAFEELKVDIAANGLRVPVLTYKGEILDGRNRERACKEVGMPVRYEEADVSSDEQAARLVFSLNQHRRHLSIAERALAAAEEANLRIGSNQYKEESEGLSQGRPPNKTKVAEAAKRWNVGVSSVYDAKIVLRDGTPQDKQDVLNRKASLRKKAAALTRRNHVPPGNGSKLVITNPGPLRSLTRKEVDPEFTGTDTDWVDKYGHVQVMTAAEYASMRFDAWASNMKTLSTQARNLPDWPTVDHNWLRNPRPAAVAKMAEALESLRPRIAEAEALLQRAEQAIKHPTKAARAAVR